MNQYINRRWFVLHPQSLKTIKNIHLSLNKNLQCFHNRKADCFTYFENSGVTNSSVPLMILYTTADKMQGTTRRPLVAEQTFIKHQSMVQRSSQPKTVLTAIDGIPGFGHNIHFHVDKIKDLMLLCQESSRTTSNFFQLTHNMIECVLVVTDNWRQVAVVVGLYQLQQY